MNQIKHPWNKKSHSDKYVLKKKLQTIFFAIVRQLWNFNVEYLSFQMELWVLIRHLWSLQKLVFSNVSINICYWVPIWKINAIIRVVTDIPIIGKFDYEIYCTYVHVADLYCVSLLHKYPCSPLLFGPLSTYQHANIHTSLRSTI